MKYYILFCKDKKREDKDWAFYGFYWHEKDAFEKLEWAKSNEAFTDTKLIEGILS